MKLLHVPVAVLCSALILSVPLCSAAERRTHAFKQTPSVLASIGGMNTLNDPAVFVSSKGELNILMIAKPKDISLGGFSPTAWVYEICLRKDAIGDSCPADGRTANPYGGVRLALQAGDHLRIRFVNQLPPAPPDAEHVFNDPMGAMLAANPTNLHTHGLIVEPRRATPDDPTYGDFIYVLGYPQGKLPSMQDPGLDYTDQPINYDIYIPKDHPSGLFWFHPHAHGLALNQVSEGLAGIITVGIPATTSCITAKVGFLQAHASATSFSKICRCWPTIPFSTRRTLISASTIHHSQIATDFARDKPIQPMRAIRLTTQAANGSSQLTAKCFQPFQ